MPLVPSKYKVDMGRVGSDKSLLGKVLFEFISPGGTAIFLVLTGVWYFVKAARSSDALEKAAFNEAAWAFLAWGILNGLIYWLLVAHQRGKLPSRISKFTV